MVTSRAASAPSLWIRRSGSPASQKSLAARKAAAAAVPPLDLDLAVRDQDERVLPLGVVVDAVAAGLDRDRPALETGRNLHQTVGGSPSASRSFSSRVNAVISATTPSSMRSTSTASGLYTVSPARLT